MNTSVEVRNGGSDQYAVIGVDDQFGVVLHAVHTALDDTTICGLTDFRIGDRVPNLVQTLLATNKTCPECVPF